jgi:hypothetical protein
MAKQGWVRELRKQFPQNQDGKDAFWRARREADNQRRLELQAMLARWRDRGYSDAYDLMVDLVTKRLGEPYRRSRDGASCYWIVPVGDRASVLRVSNHGLSEDSDRRRDQRTRLIASVVIRRPTVAQWQAAKRTVVGVLRAARTMMIAEEDRRG